MARAGPPPSDQIVGLFPNWPTAHGFHFRNEAVMSDHNDDYVYDEATGEWRPASEMAAIAAAAGQIEVRDAAGNLLADGDSVVLVKDLKVKGAGQTVKQGTVIKSIRLTDNPEEIDCRHDAIKGLVLRTEFVRKR
jgi:protein PhnA